MKPSENPGLHWTYHPIVDVGIATLTAFAEKDSPEDVTFKVLTKTLKYGR